MDYVDVEVVMACRSLKRGVGARDALVAGNPGWADRVEVLELDTSSDASVRKAAETLKIPKGSFMPSSITPASQRVRSKTFRT